jgi:hypothetical protein
MSELQISGNSDLQTNTSKKLIPKKDVLGPAAATSANK